MDYSPELGNNFLQLFSSFSSLPDFSLSLPSPPGPSLRKEGEPRGFGWGKGEKASEENAEKVRFRPQKPQI